MRRAEAPRDRLTAAEFQRAALAIEAESGIRMPDANRRTVETFLCRRLSALNLEMAPYLLRMRMDAAEYAAFIDVVTINETYFFREEKHFRILKNDLLPRWARQNERQLHFWSAACASGEEAASLMALVRQSGHADAAVLASDINPNSLERFRRGIYTDNAFRRDGTRFHPLLAPYLRRKCNGVAVTDDLRQGIEIRRINLFKDDLSALKERFHLVFLRNTLIYMTMEVRRGILDAVSKTLRPDGYLFLSASEVPLISHPHLALEQVQNTYFFRKKGIEELHQGTGPRAACAVLWPKTADLFQVSPPEEGAFGNNAPDLLFPEGLQEKYPVNPQKILSYAEQRLNNPLFEMDGDIDFSFALQFLHIVCLIGSRQYADARDLLELIDPLLPGNEISCYLRGHLEMLGGNLQLAGSHFSEALLCNSRCWPARFRRAEALRSLHPRTAAREYMACARDILAYIEENRYHYQFLLEGRNAGYFLEMCRKWCKWLEEAD